MKENPHSMAGWVMLLALALPITAFAQAYPAKPIRFVVPYPAGGPLDTVARLLGQKVSESVNQPIVVENRPGAGGNIGADHVAKSAPGGAGRTIRHGESVRLRSGYEVDYHVARGFVAPHGTYALECR